MNTSEARERLNCSTRQLGRYVTAGKLTRVRGDGGVYEYDDAQVEALALELTPDVPSPGREKAATDLLRQAHAHLEHILPTYANMSRELHDALRQENAALRERCRDLEARQLETVRLEQELLNAAHSRALELDREAKRSERRDRMVAVVEGKMEPLLSRLINGDMGKNPKVLATVKLLQSLSPEHVAALQMSGLLTDEQSALVDEILGKDRGDGNSEADNQAG